MGLLEKSFKMNLKRCASSLLYYTDVLMSFRQVSQQFINFICYTHFIHTFQHVLGPISST